MAEPRVDGVSASAVRAPWSDVRELFDAALAFPPEERDGFVKRRCPDNSALREEVLSLLRAHDAEGPVGRLPESPAAPLQKVGEYDLIELLGVGGMGAVYLAERHKDGFRQRVALKLIRAGYLDPRLEARLVEERRILARLEHPGIARFIDGGTTASGQSYFAMEFVQGTSLLSYCAERHSTLPVRLALFLDVCEAVQFAHQALVVHGDLKPDNIFITADGRAKLLDFGIAELIEPIASDTPSLRTVPWLTPAYASPEQVRGQRLSPRDDVYALGVILYELLSGHRPYDTDKLTPAELQHVVCEVDPPPPSQVARSPRDRRLLAGDLDLIVATALAKTASRRYASVQHLADDLRRYVNRRPILARRDSSLYRLRKFADRHRVGFTAGVLIFLSLLGATGVSLWQARRAEQARVSAEAALAQSESVSAFLISVFESSEPTLASDDALIARAVLQRGLTRVDELAGQPVLQARLLDAIGNVLVSLEDLASGRALLERSLALRRTVLGDTHPDVAVTLRGLARASRMQARYPEAVEQLEEALRIQRASLGYRHEAVAGTLGDLAYLMPYLNRLGAADTLYQEVLALQRSLHGPEHDAVASAILRVGAVKSRLGFSAAAESSYRAALEMSRRLHGEEHPATAYATVALADILSGRKDKAADSERLYKHALGVYEKLRGPNSDALTHPLENLGTLLVREGRPQEAEPILRRLLAIRLLRYGPDHGLIAGAEEALALAMHSLGQYAAVDSLRSSALERRRRVYGPEHPTIGHTLVGWGYLLEERGDFDRAESMVREGLRIRKAHFGARAGITALADAQLAGLLARRGEYAEAERLLLGAVDVLIKTTSPGHSDVRLTYRRLAELYRRSGNVAAQRRYEALGAAQP